jgi:hypothetical protein
MQYSQSTISALLLFTLVTTLLVLKMLAFDKNEKMS